MRDETIKKHVIILGTGASFTSGYPLANKLRLLMSCEKTLREELSSLAKFDSEYTNILVK